MHTGRIIPNEGLAIVQKLDTEHLLVDMFLGKGHCSIFLKVKYHCSSVLKLEVTPKTDYTEEDMEYKVTAEGRTLDYANYYVSASNNVYVYSEFTPKKGSVKIVYKLGQYPTLPFIQKI